MKAKNIMILAMMVIAAVSQADARQVYIYRSGMELPDTLSSDKLYFIPVGDDYIYGETPRVNDLTLIEGIYTATAQSAFSGVPDEEWTVSITRDDAEENKVWIHPICLFGGLPASSVSSVYAFVDTIQQTITVPLGQMVYPDIVLANLNGATSGDLVADYTEEGGAVSITFREGFGIPVSNEPGYWYQALMAPIFNKESSHNRNSVSNVDSISIIPPALRVKNYYLMELFNGLDIEFTTPTDEYIQLLDPDIFYKAYDKNNILVQSGQAGLMETGNIFLSILMTKMVLDESMFVFYGVLDSFLPCDTVFKVAVSLPEALFTDQYGSVSPAIESYIDADGTEHGICYTYYNARPRLLSDGELSVDAENPRAAYLEFNEPMYLYDEMKDIKYELYKKIGQSEVEFVSEGVLVYGDSENKEIIVILLPETETLETDEKYIVTVSVDSWGVGDSNVSTPLPSSVESYVDADGTPHGLWWRIDWEAPYIVSPYHLEASRNGRSVTMEFNRSIVRDNTMGAISYEVLVEEAGEARTIYQGNFPEENIAAEGRMLTVTLPESIVFERGVTYTVLLSFEEGAVEDLYGIKMEAIVNEMQEDGQPTGPWWCVNRPGLGEFFQEGEYAFDMMFDGGYGPQQLSTTANFSDTGDFDLSSWGASYTGIIAKEWSISGFLDGLIQDLTPVPFPAYSYAMTEEGETTERMTMMVASGDAPLTIAQYQGQDVYLVDYVESEGTLYFNVEFVVTTDPDLGEIAKTTSECPALAMYDEQSSGYYIIATLDDMQFYPSESLQGKSAKNGVLKATVVPTHIDGVKFGGIRKNTIK